MLSVSERSRSLRSSMSFDETFVDVDAPDIPAALVREVLPDAGVCAETVVERKIITMIKGAIIATSGCFGTKQYIGPPRQSGRDAEKI